MTKTTGSGRLFLQCTACLARWVEVSDSATVGAGHRCAYLAGLEARGLTVYPDLFFKASALKVAKTSQHTCNEECIHALGAVCKCACGGINHGVGHLFTAQVA
jgi:hypothetical protein